MNGQVLCPVLVGRAPYLAALDETIAATRARHGQALLIAGEAGIGKSRLLAEVEARAAAQGFRVLQGNCFPPDRTYPYAPVLDMLRMGSRGDPATDPADSDGPGAQAARSLFEEIQPPPGTAVAAGMDPEQEKRRRFSALTRFFLEQAARRSLLVAVEDLHWSDDTSLEFLHHLMRRCAGRPLMLVLTYRTDEPAPRLQHWLADIDRARLAQELILPPLTRDEVAQMLQAIFGLPRAARAELVEALSTLSQGNPFFVEEVLKSLVAAGEVFVAEGVWTRKPMAALRIPRSVQDAVQQRSASLSSEGRDLLRVAAVAGRRFDFAVLREVTSLSEQRLLQLLAELVAAQLVVEASADQFIFRHALTREAVYADMLTHERRSLHRSVAEATERLHGTQLDTHVSDLAYHFHAAGEWARAAEYGRRAGEQAQRLYSPLTAVEQFTRALDAATRMSEQASAVAPPTDLAALHRARGQAYDTLGDFEQARRDCEAALELGERSEDRDAEWQGLVDLGLLWASRDYARTRAYYERALELARAIADPTRIAHSLNRIGNWHTNAEEPAEALHYHEEALAIARTLGDRRGLAETQDLLGLANLAAGDLVRAKEAYTEAIELWRALDERRGLVSSLATAQLCDGYYSTDTLVVPQAGGGGPEAEEALGIARDIGWRAGEAYVLFEWAAYLGLRGEYARALAMAYEALGIAEEIEHRQWTLGAHWAIGALHLDLLALPGAQEHLVSALTLAQAMRSSNWIRTTAALLALTHLAQHELDRAQAQLDAILGPDAAAVTLGQRLCWAALAELALARGEPAAALHITDRLVSTAASLTGPAERAIPRLGKLRGEALLAMRQPAAAEAALLAAQAGAVEQQLLPLRWRIDAALGRLYRSQGRHREARDIFDTARRIIAELAANLQDPVLREQFAGRAVAMLPSPRPLTPRRAAKAAAGGLTVREREVATLIAAGKANRDIAATLFISEATVATHVSHILGKLDLASRAQVAAWAVAQGLTGSR